MSRHILMMDVRSHFVNENDDIRLKLKQDISVMR